MLVFLLPMISLFVFADYNSSLAFNNGTIPEFLLYDRENTSVNGSFYGSNAYLDFSPTNQDVRLTMCHENLSTDMYADIGYFSTGGNLTKSVLYYLPTVLTTSNATLNGTAVNCTTVNVDFASAKSIYPGYLKPIVYDNPYRSVTNATIYFDNVTSWYNGSYDIGVNVINPPKTYQMSISEILDDQAEEITTDGTFLLTSLLSPNGSLLVQETLAPGWNLNYTESFEGGEQLYVNNILSLEIRIYEGCGPINESGFYILNSTKTDVNETCVVIDNVSNVILNFGGELLDGDNLTNGSLSSGSCPVIISNSTNIALEDFQAQQFDTGICVSNSTGVNIFGGDSTFNNAGALIELESTVFMQEVYFSNTVEEIRVINDSFLSFERVNITNPTETDTVLSATFKDVLITTVQELPPAPDIEDIRDIGQFVQVNRTNTDSFANISFFYTEPLPNDAAVNNVSIFKFNGSYVNTTIQTIDNNTNATVNSSTLDWTNGTWEQLFTLVSPSESLIVGPSVTDFSVFAPYAFEVETQEDPTPEPDPDPDPQPESGASSGGGGGGGGGSGGSPTVDVEDDTAAVAENVQIELEVQGEIVLEQGQSGAVLFNISNVGNITAENVSVVAQVPRSWTRGNFTTDELGPGDVLIDQEFFIAPFEKAVPREYQIRVDAYINDGAQVVASEFFTVLVVPQGEARRLQIIEYPPVIRMPPDRALDVSFLVENRGGADLNGVRIEYQETTCLSQITGENNVESGDRKIITYRFFSNQPGECQYNVLFYDEDDILVGFAPLTLQIEYENIVQEASKRILLLLLTIWSAVTIFIILRARRRKEKEEKSDE